MLDFWTMAVFSPTLFSPLLRFPTSFRTILLIGRVSLAHGRVQFYQRLQFMLLAVSLQRLYLFSSRKVVLCTILLLPWFQMAISDPAGVLRNYFSRASATADSAMNDTIWFMGSEHVIKHFLTTLLTFRRFTRSSRAFRTKPEPNAAESKGFSDVGTLLINKARFYFIYFLLVSV